MLAWIRSPRGSTATATVVAVILALFWLAPWQKPLPSGLRLPFGAATGPAPTLAPSASMDPAAPAVPGGATPAPAAAPPPVVASLAPADSAQTGISSSSKGPGSGPVPAARDPDLGPAFDVVRVEPTGESVIAGRAAPGSDVALMDGETVIAHVQADAAGQFAFVPPSLAEGSHYLSLQTQRAGQPPVRSAQGVAVSVAPNGATKPLVALLSPDKPADVLSDGVTPAAGVPAAAGRPDPAKPGAAGAVPVAIQSVQAGQNGNFLAAGVAHPGSQCRVYLNGAYLADVTAGKDGKWSVEIKKGMQPGRYTVRADELDPAGAVSHRAEVPFEYPATVAAAAPASGAKRLLLSRRAPDPTTSAPATLPPRAATPAASPPVTGSAGPGSAATATASTAPMPSLSGGEPAAASFEAKQAPASVTKSTPASVAPPTQDASPAIARTMPPVASPASPAMPPSPATAVIPDLHTATVIRGDSLWRISRKMLGHGIQYTEIYASNTTQIRDPALIYPGQIFVVPSKHPSE